MLNNVLEAVADEQDVLLKCTNLIKQKGDFCLCGIDFELPRGYILGVIGRNGSGKTTLTRLLSGSYQLIEQNASEQDADEQNSDKHKSKKHKVNKTNISNQSNITLDGISVRQDIVAYKRQIAYVLNETPFPETADAMGVAKVYGHYYDGFDVEKYKGLLKEFEVPEKVVIKKLSKGQQIRQQLAFALSYKAKLYILDEPAANLDVEFRDTFYQYVRQMTEDGMASVIYVSHLVDELEQLADYILWIKATQPENVCALSEKQANISKCGMQKYFGTIDDLREQFQLMEISRAELQIITETATEIIVDGSSKSLSDNESCEGISDSVAKKVLEMEPNVIPSEAIIGMRERENHQELLVQIDRKELPDELKKVSRYASLKEIMYYIEKGVVRDETGNVGNMDGK